MALFDDATLEVLESDHFQGDDFARELARVARRVADITAEDSTAVPVPNAGQETSAGN